MITTLRKRADESAVIFTLGLLEFSRTTVEAGYRLVLSSDEMFEVAFDSIERSATPINVYTIRHPWRMLLGGALVDRAYYRALASMLQDDDDELITTIEEAL